MAHIVAALRHSPISLLSRKKVFPASVWGNIKISSRHIAGVPDTSAFVPLQGSAIILLSSMMDCWKAYLHYGEDLRHSKRKVSVGVTRVFGPGTM